VAGEDETVGAYNFTLTHGLQFEGEGESRVNTIAQPAAVAHAVVGSEMTSVGRGDLAGVGKELLAQERQDAVVARSHRVCERLACRPCAVNECVAAHTGRALHGQADGLHDSCCAGVAGEGPRVHKLSSCEGL
jgi:hypothetical protein